MEDQSKVRKAFLKALVYDALYNYTQEGLYKYRPEIKEDIKDRYEDIEFTNDDLEHVLDEAVEEIKDVSESTQDYKNVPVWDFLDMLQGQVMAIIDSNPSKPQSEADLIAIIKSAPLLNS